MRTDTPPAKPPADRPKPPANRTVSLSLQFKDLAALRRWLRQARADGFLPPQAAVFDITARTVRAKPTARQFHVGDRKFADRFPMLKEE